MTGHLVGDVCALYGCQWEGSTVCPDHTQWVERIRPAGNGWEFRDLGGRWKPITAADVALWERTAVKLIREPEAVPA